MRLIVSLIHDNPEDGIRNKVVGTRAKDNGLHGIHGFGMFTPTNGVMFSVYKATDKISCCLGGHYQKRMPYSYQLAAISNEDDIGNFVVSLMFHWESRKLSQPN